MVGFDEVLHFVSTSPTAAVVVLAAALLLIWELNVRRKMQVPSPKGALCFPVLGHAIPVAQGMIQDNFVDIAHGWAKDNGYQTLGFRVAGQLYVMGSTPKHVEHMLGTNFWNFEKGQELQEGFNHVLGNSIFTSDGEPWKEHRRVASHLFTAQQLRVRMRSVFERRAIQLSSVIRSTAEKGVFDLQPFFYRYTFDVINEIAFGRAVDSLGCDPTDIAFQNSFDRCQARVMRRVLFPSWIWKVMHALNIGPEVQMARDIAFINKYLADVIRSRIDGGEAEGDGEDLITLFLESSEKDGRQPAEKELRDLIMSFVIAGRDTTAALMTWTFYFLSTRPEMQDKLRAEAAQKEGDYEAMVWTQAVLQEALRLYPSVPLEFKVARKDDVLPCGARIHAGTRVMYNPFSVLRNPEVFDHPDEFRPERWIESDGTCTKYDMQGFKYPAFNAGPRICLGRGMAMMEAKVVVSHLLQDFTFTLEPGFLPQTKFTVVLASGTGMRVAATPRTAP